MKIKLSERDMLIIRWAILHRKTLFETKEDNATNPSMKIHAREHVKEINKLYKKFTYDAG